MAYDHKIPDNLNPTGTICVPVFLPKDAEYISLFLYVVRTLTHDRHYERDPNNSALTVREVWRQTTLNPLISTLANGIPCGDDMLVRQNPENPCILEESEDGEIWTQFADITECVDSGYIYDLISGNQSLQELIATFADTSSIDGDSTESVANLSSQLIDNPVSCDDAIIFGMTTQLVEFADRLIKDLFERLSAQQLSSVNVGYLIKLIPVLETLPIDELFELTDKLINDMETAYLSASVQLLKDEIACDLFCIAKDNNCVLTLEDVRDYYQDKANIVFSYDSVLAFMLDFISGTFIGNAVYYGMNIFFFQIFAFAGKFLEYFFDDYLRTINSMYNDPNGDYITLCDDCPVSTTLEALQLTDQLLPAIIQFGTFNEVSFAVDHVNISGSTMGVRVYFEVPNGAVVKHARMTYDVQSNGGDRQNRILDGIDGTGTILSQETPTANTNHEFRVLEFNGSHTVTNGRIQFSVNANIASGSYCDIREIIVTYETQP